MLRGRDDASERAVIPLTYPNFEGGNAQAVLVRTANPGEYKADGATIRARGFNAHPVVHACIRVIADLVASVPLVVLRERGDQTSRVPESHPLQQVLDYPAPRFTARQFRARFAVDFLGYGNALFQMERTGRRVTGLRPINPESLQSVWVDPEGDPRRYDYGNWNGIIVTSDAADILHFRDLEMEAPFKPDVFGYPRGASALQSLMADYEAGHYVRQVVTNDGTPTFAVMLADEATQEDAQAMQDRYKARVVDRGKRGTPAFFGAVKDIKPLGFTLSDLEFPSLRKVAREDICAAFGVDPRMVGIASASNDAGLSGVQYVEARARLVQHTIEPMFAALEDEINHWLAPEFGDVYVTYDHDVLRDLVENDEATSLRIDREFKAGLRTWQESRTALKLSPVPEPTDAILQTLGSTLTPAALAVIDPSTIREPEPEDVGTPASDMAEPPESEELEDEDEEENEEDDDLDAEDIDAEDDDDLEDDATRAEDVTNFPNEGDDKKVSLRNSQWALFPVGEAEDLQENWPEIWRKGGNIKGNAQFAKLALIAKRGGVPNGEAEENAIRLREAWVARHDGDFQLAGVVAQIKWLAVGSRGLDHMRKVIREAKEAAKDRSATRSDAALPLDEQGRPWWVHLPKDQRPKRAATEAEKYAYWKRAVDEMERGERTYYGAAKTLFSGERRAVGRAFGVRTRQDLVLAEILRRIEAGYAPGGEYYEAWREAYLRLIAPTYLNGAKQVGGGGAGVGFDFTLQSTEVVRAIEMRAARLAQLVGEETAKQVNAAVLAGERAGLSVREIGRLIQATVYGESMTDARATRIARTESAGAMSQGAWDQAQAMGDLYVAKEWLSFEDGKTRETHLACSAQGIIPIGQAFSNGLGYPLDPRGPAGEVINCRCVLAYYDTLTGD